MNKRTDVLFIGGFFRSGTTILDRMLRGVLGFLSAELRFVCKESFLEVRMGLQPDVEWERAMSRSDTRKATALTWPFLLRYGYLGTEG